MQLQIFELTTDYNYHGFSTWSKDSEKVEEYRLDGTPRLETWKPLSIYWDKPKLGHANFEYSFLGGYALDQKACQLLEAILEGTCELLPLLPCDGNKYYLMNILGTWTEWPGGGVTGW
jgi:hypothetical protein